MLQKICVVLLSVAIFIGVTSAVICYECNSEYDPRCGDPFDPYSLGQVNCSMKEHPEHLTEKSPASLCRKTTQKIFGKIRVVRGCGYLTDEHANKECLKRSGTFEVQSFFCSCDEDLCNGAVTLMGGRRNHTSSHMQMFVMAAVVIAVTTILPFIVSSLTLSSATSQHHMAMGVVPLSPSAAAAAAIRIMKSKQQSS